MRCERFGRAFVISGILFELTPDYQFLAIRIYSATVNSMADERTASNFTWFNSGLRNRQNVSTLTWMIQIRQWALHLVRRSVSEYQQLKAKLFDRKKKKRPQHKSGPLSHFVKLKKRSSMPPNSAMLSIRAVMARSLRAKRKETLSVTTGARIILTLVVVHSRVPAPILNWMGQPI